MKICVLQPDYSTTGVDYQYYDPQRKLAHLLPDDEVVNASLNKLTTYKQLQKLSKQGFDVFVNLCEGYLEWEVPSIDVIHSLELLNLPYTGPTPTLYDPPKTLMKYVAYCEGVRTPHHFVVQHVDDWKQFEEKISFPLFIKPSKAGDSLGVHHDSKVDDLNAAIQKTTELLKEFPELLVEEYIEGREFTVLVAANPDGKTCRTFKPIEYIFPEGFAFKTYALKTSELHPGANIPCDDPVLEAELRNIAEKIFKGFGGKGYARLDLRVKPDGSIYFLEINFTCSVFYADGYEGSADFILKYDGIGQSGFLQHIIEEGIARHQRKQKAYVMRGDAISGFGIYANRPISMGEVLYHGEGRPHRIVTREFIDQQWDDLEKKKFRQYAWPLGGNVYAIWDEAPDEWSPQNHSCNANTSMQGLNMIASRDIKAGEELTLDYAVFLDNTMESFACSCGSPNCQGTISGQPA